MITQIKKNLPDKRKVEILEKLLTEAWQVYDKIEVDYIGILSDIMPFTAEIYFHKIYDPLIKGGSIMAVRIEPTAYRDIFNAQVKSVHQFVQGLVYNYSLFDNLRINGKKIEY